jgi:hypothetical protein
MGLATNENNTLYMRKEKKEVIIVEEKNYLLCKKANIVLSKLVWIKEVEISRRCYYLCQWEKSS